MAEKIEHLEMCGITKRFPGVLSNRDVNIHIKAGEVLAILGENGAGKTTLMNILYGLYQADEGKILLNGKPVKINSPREAIAHGIGMVHQHFMLVPTLTVSENVILGLSKTFLVDLKTAAQRIQEITDTYGLAINPDAYVWQLSVGEQQRVEIIKALYRGANLLILDEPTAVLTPQESNELIQLLRNMSAQGNSIILISHKLHEVMALSDRVTVLRDGEVCADVLTRDTSQEALAQLMVGREMAPCRREGMFSPGKTVLELQDVFAHGDKGTEALAGVSLTIREGEILGIAGVSGNGQKELAEVIAGLRKLSKGRISLNGKDCTKMSPARIIQQGLGYIPEDRLHVGTLPSFSIWENLILKDHHLPPFAKRLLLQNRVIMSHSSSLVEKYGIKTPNLETPTGRLSGGNIQRVILAREITRSPVALVAAYPTRGLDIGATEYLHSKLLEARGNGIGIMLISEDLEELLSICDNIAVLYEGRVMKVMSVEETDERILGLLMAGIAEEAS
ncbi:ABC transporter ATP-binding protein [Desulfosporosinus fructosivorans]|uniref:ABC transporter ATP-binding protein n=1 Tax=Desulfosporosinus fructosivorans TaxID=2018669 RepID=A0A4Z0R714_9FIRM|nr:ABC transporter ATP-binding protein [Desulfosporosinus fructosivorans]TGE38600.1 ABC transporter ATP-binding protein [Desulfosporosinus fructosivorans]